MKFRDKYDFNNSIDDGGKSTIRNSPRYFGNNYNHKISLADLDQIKKANNVPQTERHLVNSKIGEIKNSNNKGFQKEKKNVNQKIYI